VTDAILATFQQWALFTGVVVVLGCVCWSAVVSPGAALAAMDHGRALRIERRVASLGAVTSFLLIAVWALRMVVQVIGFRDPFVPLWDDVSFLLFETFWGTVWMAQGAVLPLLAFAFLFGRPRATTEGASLEEARRAPVARWLVVALALALAATLMLSSHAMGVDSWRAAIVGSDGLHLLAAGCWIGSLAIVLGPGRKEGLDLFGAQLRAFSPLAVVSVTTLLTMGVVLSWTHLTAFSDLWATTYGRVLSAKIGVAGIVLLAGLWNWRVGLPNLGTESGAARVRGRAAFEVSMAAVVLLITAVLVHSPKP